MIELREVQSQNTGNIHAAKTYVWQEQCEVVGNGAGEMGGNELRGALHPV